ncbi:MAG: hypothetical protein WDW38_007795 [Sanguina aurantia]
MDGDSTRQLAVLACVHPLSSRAHPTSGRPRSSPVTPDIGRSNMQWQWQWQWGPLDPERMNGRGCRCHGSDPAAPIMTCAHWVASHAAHAAQQVAAPRDPCTHPDEQTGHRNGPPVSPPPPDIARLLLRRSHTHAVASTVLESQT